MATLGMATLAGKTPILARVDWANANRLTRHQVRNREIYCPPISLFRWWARRPHALVSALLDASSLKAGALVSDPISGGGTVTWRLFPEASVFTLRMSILGLSGVFARPLME